MSINSVSSQSSTYWDDMFASSASRKTKNEDDPATKLFTDLDVDGNGEISLEESGLDQETYDALDVDHDGMVSLPELETALELQRAAMFTRIKMNGQTEQEGPPPANEDAGKPNARELLAAVMNGTPLDSRSAGADTTEQSGMIGDFASVLFSDPDADGSGGITGSEAGGSQSVFDSMDTNRDGVVSAEELAAALNTQMESMTNGADSAGTAQRAKNMLSSLAGRMYNAISQAIFGTEQQQTDLTV